MSMAAAYVARRGFVPADWSCVYCNTPEQQGPCFGWDRCMAVDPLRPPETDADPQPPATHPNPWTVATLALVAVVVLLIVRRNRCPG